MIKFKIMKRIFVAINLPEEIREKLADIQEEIIAMYPENSGIKMAKWVKKENLHITLLYIGEVLDKTEPRTKKVLKEIVENYGPISITFNKVSYGPDNKIPPKLVWVKLAENPELAKLAKEIKAKMVERSILEKPDKRPFQGHITLGRIRQWQWKNIDPTERPNIEQGLDISFTAESVELMESKLRKEGAEYNVVQSILLV